MTANPAIVSSIRREGGGSLNKNHEFREVNAEEWGDAVARSEFDHDYE